MKTTIAFASFAFLSLSSCSCSRPAQAGGEGEGEGAGGEGEGAAAGEGEGAAGEGEGEGVSQSCTQNSDCPLDNICVASQCAPGCQGNRDCRQGLLCNTAATPNGACQQCLANTDCNAGAGEICFNGTCSLSCTRNTDCTQGNRRVCDTTNSVCVECVGDVDCPTGTVCSAAQCVPGCRANTDCPLGTICSGATASGAGQCVDGCATDAGCPLGTFCNNAHCDLGCNNDNTRCAANQTCSTQTCVTTCTAGGNQCAPGETCVGTACEVGCATSNDCGFRLPACDTSAGTPGTCVECLVDNDCNNGATCDTAAHLCRQPCNGTQCDNGQVCNTTGNLCVDCLANTDCATGQTCDTTSHTCVVTAGGNTLCEPCNSDAQCGATNQCVTIRGGNQGGGERACGLDCSTGTSCPSGFACHLIAGQNNVVTAEQCEPASSVSDNATCAAFLDTVNKTACDNNGACGLPQVNDGVCIGATQGTQGVCSEPCGTASDCPTGFSCQQVATAGGANNACLAP
jgi:Cys-rich repeat protein